MPHGILSIWSTCVATQALAVNSIRLKVEIEKRGNVSLFRYAYRRQFIGYNVPINPRFIASALETIQMDFFKTNSPESNYDL